MLIRTLTLCALPLLAQSASAVVLLTDDFDSGGPNTQNVATQNLAGRLGGTLAPGYISAGTAYIQSTNDHHQIGNTGTNTGHPTFTDGNYILVAFDGGFQTSLDIAAAGAGGPISISFDMYLRSADNSSRVGGDTTQWGAFTLRAPGNSNGNTWPVAGGGEYGFLNRFNGGIEQFQNGSASVNPVGWDTPNFALGQHWEFIFSDTAGTGSAFNGNGSRVTVINSGNTLGTVTLGQLNSSGLHAGWRNLNAMFIGVDNLEISIVPEPSGMALLAAGLGLALRRRRA